MLWHHCHFHSIESGMRGFHCLVLPQFLEAVVFVVQEAVLFVFAVFVLGLPL